ncbi:hypothetical protein F5051DRAFT_395504 [Lentinula edodes]|nr:hypothetical protein F5051DRAFT_395504 [Lentinula edodes]
MVGIWDLWVMRAGTGEMLFEEIVLQKLEIVLSKLPINIPSNHWLSDPIHQVFPHATEVALNTAYLFLTLAGWTPALLFALSSVVLTLGQTISLCIQAHFYPNFLSKVIHLSTVSWSLVLIFRVLIPSLVMFVICRELCCRLLEVRQLLG